MRPKGGQRGHDHPYSHRRWSRDQHWPCGIRHRGAISRADYRLSSPL